MIHKVDIFNDENLGHEFSKICQNELDRHFYTNNVFDIITKK